MSWFSKLSPIPAFPDYSGPYQVGTVDVEIPAAQLQSQSQSPAPESAPPTVAFRIFYPCENQSASSRPVRWIPQPQKATVSAFGRFMGAGSRYSEIFSLFSHLAYYINIPAHRNAPLLTAPTHDKRWPVMVFSHGLAGSRNMYSHICGSLSSHGLVVIAMDHRDGSSPIQYVRATDKTESQIIDVVKMPHTPSPEVYEGRDKQLRIRMWELGLAHSAVIGMDKGEKLENLDENTSYDKKERTDVLARFANSLDVHEPGRITFAGHSFGAATTVQFSKSVFYAKEKPKDVKPLFAPEPGSPISRQITSSTPVALLDLWCLPLRSPGQDWLWRRPMPSFTSGGQGGKSIVSILSQGFYNWTGNFNDAKRATAPPRDYHGPNPNPYLFYPKGSQHFSQSDFGILFPLVTSRFLKAMEPERVLKLNMRAVLQMLRENDVEVANTSTEDREVGEEEDTKDDKAILEDQGVRGWVYISSTDKLANGGISVDKDQKRSPSDVLSSGGKLEL